jgi:Zn-finger nucleic acid-binding protein
MPLISSPIDGSPMREIERYGVKIDICQTSGGVWLDRGELEKIIVMIREEALREAGGHDVPPAPPYDRDPRSMAQRPGTQHRPQGKKRDSMFDNLMDIFDF